MEIDFENSRLKHTIEDEKACRRKWGHQVTEKLKLRMADLEAVDNLEGMRSLLGSCEELKGRGRGIFSVTLAGGDRLAFTPMGDSKSYTKADKSIDWEKVVAIKIIGVGDYHKY